MWRTNFVKKLVLGVLSLLLLSGGSIISEAHAWEWRDLLRNEVRTVQNTLLTPSDAACPEGYELIAGKNDQCPRSLLVSIEEIRSHIQADGCWSEEIEREFLNMDYGERKVRMLDHLQSHCRCGLDLGRIPNLPYSEDVLPMIESCYREKMASKITLSTSYYCALSKPDVCPSPFSTVWINAITYRCEVNVPTGDQFPHPFIDPPVPSICSYDYNYKCPCMNGFAGGGLHQPHIDEIRDDCGKNIGFSMQYSYECLRENFPEFVKKSVCSNVEEKQLNATPDGFCCMDFEKTKLFSPLPDEARIKR